MHNFSFSFTHCIGCAPGIKLSLKLRPQFKPIDFCERNLPYALWDPVATELESLVKADLYTPINLLGSPLVVTPKPDRRVRLYDIDKCTVYDQFIDANFPIQKMEVVLHRPKHSRYFCTLDFYEAYLHFEVDKESALIQAVSIHKGTYKVNYLNYGIKTAFSECNRIMHQILHDIPTKSSLFWRHCCLWRNTWRMRCESSQMPHTSVSIWSTT